MSRVEARVDDLGLTLSLPKVPDANYLVTKRSGILLFVSGRGSEQCGQVGTDVREEEAKLAAKDTMLDLLTTLFGESGMHPRTATGVAPLPYGASMQLDLVAEV